MFGIIVQALAWLTFLIATIILGAWLRSNPNKSHAEITSRILHLLFWIFIVPLIGFGFIYPGISHFDKVLRLSSLPENLAISIIGALSLLIGMYLIIVSEIALIRFGKGVNALFLTKELVIYDLYQRLRNPMSLGFYLTSIGIGLLTGSTYLTLGALLIAIPAHIFYLKYFEEYELELRMGQPYVEYKQKVPCLLPKLFSRMR
jgi:protein-S-isoprenylcysteine O-methyltransferase Ste14